MKHTLIAGTSVLLMASFSAPGQETGAKRAGVPIYNVTVVERTTKAINYQYRSGPTTVDLRGTVLMPDAKGEAIVESKRGRTEIDVAVSRLVAPSRFGREYLTYTLWAITPEGAPRNIGELIPNGSDRVRMHVSTDLQAFGLIVTAEPYSSAHHPSDVVVLENQVRPDTIGEIKEIQAKYELMPRGHYTYDTGKLKNETDNLPKVSMAQYEALLQLYEAQNATAIAQAASADKYAPQTFEKAQELLANAQRLKDSKAAPSAVVQAAREAAQTAEDARTIAERRSQEAKVATLQAEAESAHRARAQAEGEAQRLRTDADSARAEAAAERAARERAEVEVANARQQASPPVIATTVEVPPPAASPRQADSQKLELRMRLLEQMNQVVASRDTPRGLVATIGDSNFMGNELSSRVSSGFGRLVAILQSYPDLQISVEGYSDAAATESQAQGRADRVRQLLLSQGLPPDRLRSQRPPEIRGPWFRTPALRAAHRIAGWKS